jgi:hypothetical protein
MKPLDFGLLALLLTCSGLAEGAAHATPPRCDNETLLRSLGRLRGGAAVHVVKGQGEVALELVRGSARETLLRASCERIEVPFAERLERPSKQARTEVAGGIVLARTASGAISLDIARGLADREELHLLVLDDDSLSIVRGDKVFYAFATLPDGSTVESEGIGNGCGCERTTDANGKVTTRPLPR